LAISNPDNTLVEPTASYANKHCLRTFITETTPPPPLFSTSTPTPEQSPTDLPTVSPTDG
jgi:hypothetical protein